MEKKDKVRKILMYAGWAIIAVMVAMLAVFAVKIFCLGILTVPYKIALIGATVVITGLFTVLQRWLVPGIIGKVLAIVVSVLMVIGIRYLGATSKALDKMTDIKTQIDNVCVYVLNDSEYGNIDSLNNGKYGILESIDRDNTNKAIAMIEKETSTQIDYNEYANAITLIDALYNNDVDAIILNSSFLVLFEDLDGYTDAESRIKSIWSADIETEVVDSNGSNGNNAGDNKEPETDPYQQYKDYLYGGDDVFTLYVSGIDTNGSPMVNRNSDVNILITVNTKTRQILMISTPRDFYVPLSISNGVRDKLTHAGCYGIQVSVDTLEMLYGVNIDDYIKVNFTGFVDVIDSLGGVDVYSEYDFVPRHGTQHFTVGYNHVNGTEALGFARERYSFSGGDRQRGRNQMAVIKAIIEKCASTDALLNYESILSAVSSSIATTMTMDEITGLVKMQLSDMRGWNIQSYSADGTGSSQVTYSIPTPKYVMIPNQATIDQAKEYLRQTYAGETVNIQ